MQFSLCNAPATFQCMVDDILEEEHESGHVKVYVDDILIHTPDSETNCLWVERVLNKLKANQLFCRERKCQFEVDSVEFLGMKVAEGIVGISPLKVDTILREEPLKTKKGVRRFLGLTNYHRHFIKDYSWIARPLHDLTRDVPFAWTEECQQSFDGLKTVLTMSPVLALLRDEGKFCLETDVSDVTTRAVLLQEQEDGVYKPLGFSSKLLGETEQWYMTYDKELLGIMRGLEEWQSLLIGSREPFEICTDHRNLSYFREPQKLMG
jgi:hypothetical protein